MDIFRLWPDIERHFEAQLGPDEKAWWHTWRSAPTIVRQKLSPPSTPDTPLSKTIERRVKANADLWRCLENERKQPKGNPALGCLVLLRHEITQRRTLRRLLRRNHGFDPMHPHRCSDETVRHFVDRYIVAHVVFKYGLSLLWEGCDPTEAAEQIYRALSGDAALALYGRYMDLVDDPERHETACFSLAGWIRNGLNLSVNKRLQNALARDEIPLLQKLPATLIEAWGAFSTPRELHAVRTKVADLLTKDAPDHRWTKGLEDNSHSYENWQYEDWQARRECLRDLMDLMERVPLSSRERTVIDLSLQGYTLPEIAQTLGMSVETVKTYKMRGMKKIRTLT